MKDKDHHMRHPRGHLRDRASAQRTPGCAWRDDQFGCGQNTVLGWSDPTFAHDCVAKVNRGSLQPNKQLRAVRARREFRRSRCRRQELPTATSSSPPSSRWNVRKSRESEEINDTRMRRVTQKKTPDWAGATPLFGSQSAQKFCPGRSRPLLHSGAHFFWPRAKQPRSWPSNPQVPVKWASPLYFTATSPATSPSIEDGITEINQMNRPEERNCARPRPCLRRERPHPLTHGASRLPCGRSRPHRNFGAAFCVIAYTQLRVCQTGGLTFCMKTKGEARCLF
jgi:hypothetical protein